MRFSHPFLHRPADFFARSGRRSASGFALLEVLVALVLAAVSLIASISATAKQVQVVADLSVRLQASWSAENRIAFIRASREWPQLGRRQFDCPQNELDFVCEEEVSTTSYEDFRRVEVSVSDEANHRLSRLVAFTVRE